MYIMDDERERRKAVFYEEYADGGFKFGSDQILKVTTAILAEKSPVFQKLFKDSPTDRVVEIRDYDFATFKLFLDCLLGFQDYSVPDALLLFPIARKYETEKFINKCLNILRPVELNENVCMTLNIALCCNCEELKESVINFLKGETLIYQIFHEEKFYSLLEPESVCEQLFYIEIDSYIIEIVFKWGNGYLSKNNKPGDLKSFFLENGITEAIPVYSFETSQALFDFNDSELGKGFYSNNVEEYFKYFGEKVDTRKCAWFDIKAGETLTEKIKVKDFAVLSGYSIIIQVSTNKVVFYEDLEGRIIPEYEYCLKIVDANKREIKTDVKHVYSNLAPVYNNRGQLCVWLVDNINNNCMSECQFVFKRTFDCDCRILKTSPKDFKVTERNPENLYFTDRVKLELRKK